MIRELETAEPSAARRWPTSPRPTSAAPGCGCAPSPIDDPAQAEALAAIVAAGARRMSRRHLTFACEGETLAGTLDDAPGDTGLLLVSGGNEIRAGAFAGQAQLAARIAAAGFPVFRFDRRGVGDSSGANRGFRDSGADIAAALAAFRRDAPGPRARRRLRQLRRGERADARRAAPAATRWCSPIPGPSSTTTARRRPRRSARATPPSCATRRSWCGWRPAKSRCASSPAGSAARCAPPRRRPRWRRRWRPGSRASTGPVRLLLAERDRTAQAFLAAWDADDPRLARCPGASHAFVEPDARDWLFGRIMAPR